jgi:hypothetical protein
VGDDLLGESDSNDDADKSDGSNYAREIEAIQDGNLASDDYVNDESEDDSDDNIPLNQLVGDKLEIHRETGDVLVICGKTQAGSASKVPWFGMVSKDSCGAIPIRWMRAKQGRNGEWEVDPTLGEVTIQEGQVQGTLLLEDNQMTAEKYRLARNWVVN